MKASSYFPVIFRISSIQWLYQACGAPPQVSDRAGGPGLRCFKFQLSVPQVPRILCPLEPCGGPYTVSSDPTGSAVNCRFHGLARFENRSASKYDSAMMMRSVTPRGRCNKLSALINTY